MRPLDFVKPSVILISSLIFLLPFNSIAQNLFEGSDSIRARYQHLYLKNKAEEALATGHVQQAIAYLANALPTDLDNPDRPLTKEALDLLYHIHYNEDVLSGTYAQDSLVFTRTHIENYSVRQFENYTDLYHPLSKKRIPLPFKIHNETYRVRFSPDSSQLMCLTNSGIWIWDTQTGMSSGDLIVDAFFGTFSPDGKQILVLSQERDVRVVNLADRSVEYKNRFPRAFVAAYSNCGNYVALVPFENKNVVEIWNIKEETLVVRRYPKKRVDNLIFSDDDRYLYIQTYSSHTRIGGIPEVFPMRHKNNILDVKISPNQKYIATAAADSTARIWDAFTGKPLTPLLKHPVKAVRTVEFSPCSNYLLSTADNLDKLFIWDVVTGKKLSSSISIPGEIIRSAKFSPCGKYIIIATDILTAYIYDLKTGKTVFPDLIHPGKVWYAEISPNSKYAVTTSASRVRVWDLAGWNGESKIKVKSLIDHDAFIYKAIFSPDSRKVASYSSDSTIKILDVNTGAQLGKDMKHKGHIIDIAFSKDSKKLVTVSRDSTAIVWDIFTGKQLLPPFKHNGYTGKAAFLADDKYLAVACWDRNTAIWDLVTGELAIPYLSHERRAQDVVVSQDERFLVTGSLDQSARIWNLLKPQELIKLYVKDYRDRIQLDNISEDIDFLKNRYLLSEAKRCMAAKDTAQAISRLLNAIPESVGSNETLSDPIIRSSLDMLADIYNYSAATKKVYNIKRNERGFKYSQDKSLICSINREFANVYDSNKFDPVLSVKHKSGVNDCIITHDNEYLITLSRNGEIEKIRIKDGISMPLDMVHENAFQLLLNKEGNKLYSYPLTLKLLEDMDKNDLVPLKLWDINTGKLLDEYQNPGNDLEISPDGKYVVTCKRDKVVVTEISSGKNLYTISDSTYNSCSVEVCPYDNLLAISFNSNKETESHIRIYDIGSGKEIYDRLYPGSRIVIYGLKFIGNDKNLLLKNTNGKVQIWDIETGLPSFAPLPDKVSLIMYDENNSIWEHNKKLIKYNPITYQQLVDYYRKR